jgi:hypothetical protein
VYPEYHLDLKESDFEPLKHPMKWGDREDDTYAEVKRQAECALYRNYGHIASVSVRFPFVAGVDDYTKRLFFYVDHIKNRKPMYINNLDERMSFIPSSEAGKFMASLAGNHFNGPINASSSGSISIREIIQYIEKKTGVQMMFSSNGEIAPYNDTLSHSLNLKKSRSLGYHFPDISTWMYSLLDGLIAY